MEAPSPVIEAPVQTVESVPAKAVKPVVETIVQPRSKAGPAKKKASKKSRRASHGAFETPPAVKRRKVDHPHLEARFVTSPTGQVMTSVDFNAAFVAQIDLHYRNDPNWSDIQEDNVKVALFLHGILSEMVEPYLPSEKDSLIPVVEDLDNIPLLAVRGGEENVTRVDVADAKRVGQF